MYSFDCPKDFCIWYSFGSYLLTI